MPESSLTPTEIEQGITRFVDHLRKMLEDDPELGDVHTAFEQYCLNRYGFGSEATNLRTGEKNDCGVDFYSIRECEYRIGQCKVPTAEWIEANPGKARKFSTAAISDIRDSIAYLLGESKLNASDELRHLYGRVQSDRKREGFKFIAFLIIFGKLDSRAEEEFRIIKEEQKQNDIAIVLHTVGDLIDDFLIGSIHSTGPIQITIRTDRENVLTSNDYCYFLGNAADIYEAFRSFGWRLFDLNVRYEVRNSPVNTQIVESLRHRKSRERFHHVNNGIIITAEAFHLSDGNKKVKLTRAQIVNGLQTVKSINNAVLDKLVSLDDLEQGCHVQVKVIRTNDEKFTNQIVQATNNQNPMSPRNLKSNDREQKTLRKSLSELSPKWFLQVKQGEWDSLNEDGGRFFKAVTGLTPVDFKTVGKKKGRTIDNQEAAKAWLCFTGFASIAQDRTTHFFSENEIYEKAFKRTPLTEHWNAFAAKTDFSKADDSLLEASQGSAYQYLLAYFILQYVKSYVPGPYEYRSEALDEGVKAGRIKKSDGEFITSVHQQEEFLAENETYQTWRLLANMKEILVEAVSWILVKRYGALNDSTCRKILRFPEPSRFCQDAEIGGQAELARSSSDLNTEDIFSRMLGMLKWAGLQFWEAKRSQILSTSRLRTLLYRADMVDTFKMKILEVNNRKSLDQPWKNAGTTFLESLPELPLA